MRIIDHGRWVSYKPAKLPLHAPPNTLFAKRESDGMDWYDYHRDPNSFKNGSIKMTVDVNRIVQAVYRDASMLFPQRCLLLEIVGDDVEDPHAKYNRQIYDPETNTLSLPVPPDVIDPAVGHSYALQADGALDKVMAIKPISHRYRNVPPFADDGKRHLGFLASNLTEVIPAAVLGEDGGKPVLSLDTVALLSLLTKAVQELTARVEKLEGRHAS